MGQASMRKWISRARAYVAGEMRKMPPGQQLATPAWRPGCRTLGDWVRAEALHMRLRERKRREFWRMFGPDAAMELAHLAVVSASDFERRARELHG